MEVNNFSLEYAKDESNASIGQWYPVSGKPVFPFSFGSLLDEKLDEAIKITGYEDDPDDEPFDPVKFLEG